MSEMETRTALREWIVKANGKIRQEDLHEDTPILEQRIVTSLQIMDLILFLEQLRAKPIDVENLKPGVFRTLNDIHRNFFEDFEKEEKP